MLIIPACIHAAARKERLFITPAPHRRYRYAKHTWPWVINVWTAAHQPGTKPFWLCLYSRALYDLHMNSILHSFLFYCFICFCFHWFLFAFVLGALFSFQLSFQIASVQFCFYCLIWWSGFSNYCNMEGVSQGLSHSEWIYYISIIPDIRRDVRYTLDRLQVYRMAISVGWSQSTWRGLGSSWVKTWPTTAALRAPLHVKMPSMKHQKA